MLPSQPYVLHDGFIFSNVRVWTPFRPLNYTAELMMFQVPHLFDCFYWKPRRKGEVDDACVSTIYLHMLQAPTIVALALAELYITKHDNYVVRQHMCEKLSGHFTLDSV